MFINKLFKKKKVEKDNQQANLHKNSPVIIIHGAGTTKVGYSGEKFPRFVVPEQSINLHEEIQQFPLYDSQILDLEELHNSWRSIVEKLQIDLLQQPILLSLPSAKITDNSLIQNIREFFFEELQANRLAIITDAFLSLIGYLPILKRLTGLIIDFGFSQIRVVPIHNGSVIEDHIAQASCGGLSLTKQLGKWLKEQGYQGPLNSLLLREIKENFCFVRPFGKEIVKEEKESFNYSFQDEEFTLTEERWKLAELLFYKKFFAEKVLSGPRIENVGIKVPLSELTLPRMIGTVIRSLPNSLWKELFTNICLSGGGANFDGMAKRLEEELQYLYPKQNIRILYGTYPTLKSFLGASKLTQLPIFQNYWITKKNYYDEYYNLFI
ncbi:MAG: hypothetical protein GF308_03510 [Candidatus Heimdallarchaeota archaeon]|nr:hypothetical protein [Candidatus Heimdallarchaeota archaeon]